MILGIVGAMEVEVDALKNAMKDPLPVLYAGMEFYSGSLEGVDAVVVKCGVGKVNAAMCTQILCDCFGVTHLVNTGIAGSLDEELRIGQMVVSCAVLHHDFDCTTFGYAPNQIPGMPEFFMPEWNLVRLAVQAADEGGVGTLRSGIVASGDQFISDSATKQRIKETTRALCVEMEGAAIAQTAFRNGVPFVIIRAISDNADDCAEFDYPSFEEQTARRCAQFILQFAKQLSAESLD